MQISFHGRANHFTLQFYLPQARTSREKRAFTDLLIGVDDLAATASGLLAHKYSALVKCWYLAEMKMLSRVPDETWVADAGEALEFFTSMRETSRSDPGLYSVI